MPDPHFHPKCVLLCFLQNGLNKDNQIRCGLHDHILRCQRSEVEQKCTTSFSGCTERSDFSSAKLKPAAGQDVSIITIVQLYMGTFVHTFVQRQLPFPTASPPLAAPSSLLWQSSEIDPLVV